MRACTRAKRWKRSTSMFYRSSGSRQGGSYPWRIAQRIRGLVSLSCYRDSRWSKASTLTPHTSWALEYPWGEEKETEREKERRRQREREECRRCISPYAEVSTSRKIKLYGRSARNVVRRSLPHTAAYYYYLYYYFYYNYYYDYIFGSYTYKRNGKG